MSKAHRGTGIRKEINHGRGTCGICKTENIKTLYEQDVEGKKVKICKFCKANLKNKARVDARKAKQAAAAEASSEAPATEA